jgi:hypothetical protein
LAASYLAAFARGGRGGFNFTNKDFFLKKEAKTFATWLTRRLVMLRSVTRLCAGATF